MQKLLIAVGCLYIAAVYAEQVNTIEYGQCAVSTDMDEFTDTVNNHALLCRESDSSLSDQLMLMQDNERLMVAAKVGRLPYRLKRAEVTYRVDKGEVMTESWQANDGVAFTRDGETSLGHLRPASKVAIQVGSNRHTFELEAEAFADWLRRTGRTSNQ